MLTDLFSLPFFSDCWSYWVCYGCNKLWSKWFTCIFFPIVVAYTIHLMYYHNNRMLNVIWIRSANGYKSNAYAIQGNGNVHEGKKCKYKYSHPHSVKKFLHPVLSGHGPATHRPCWRSLTTKTMRNPLAVGSVTCSSTKRMTGASQTSCPGV